MEASLVRQAFRALEEPTLTDRVPLKIRKDANKILEALHKKLLPRAPEKPSLLAPTIADLRRCQALQQEYKKTHGVVQRLRKQSPHSNAAWRRDLKKCFPNIPATDFENCKDFQYTDPAPMARAIVAHPYGLTAETVRKALARASDTLQSLTNKGFCFTTIYILSFINTADSFS